MRRQVAIERGARCSPHANESCITYYLAYHEVLSEDSSRTVQKPRAYMKAQRMPLQASFLIRKACSLHPVKDAGLSGRQSDVVRPSMMLVCCHASMSTEVDIRFDLPSLGSLNHLIEDISLDRLIMCSQGHGFELEGRQ